MKGSNKQSGKIESSKVYLKQVLNDYWFRVPEYQRSYIWKADQINNLIDDIEFAQQNSKENDYFLGSVVLKKNELSIKKNDNEIDFVEYDVLDGQQRLTTILLLLAVIRDLTDNRQLRTNCSQYIYQEENEFENIPERLRLVYAIRDNVEDFFGSYIKELNGTIKFDELKEKTILKNTSISNMSNAILLIHGILKEWEQSKLSSFSKYLLNNVLIIYVSTEDLEDAFRLFTILNDRGVPLANIDIIKAQNLGAIQDEKINRRYALIWEEIETNLGRDEFDRLLSYIRTILVKEKARENILKEFNEKIYRAKNPLLSRGVDTIDFIKEYAEIYSKLYYFSDLPASFTNEYRNLIKIMYHGLPSTDWVPPLMHYYNKFGEKDIITFLVKLDNKFSADWINQLTPTFRIQNMNDILKAIDKYSSANDILNDENLFDIDYNELKSRISGSIYTRRFTKYLLLKLEYISKDHSSEFANFNYISVEHVLPQNPSNDSDWWIDFDEEYHKEWINKLGNLVLLSRRKNSQLSNKEFSEKKKRYFSGNIDAFPNSLRVMQYNEWTKVILENRHNELVKVVMDSYKK